MHSKMSQCCGGEMCGKGMRGNVSMCQNSGENATRPETVSRKVGGREWTKGDEGVCQEPDSLENHCQDIQRTTGQDAEMRHLGYRHIPMLRRSANCRVTERGPARGPVRPPTGNRNHVRRRNHLRHRLMPRDQA